MNELLKFKLYIDQKKSFFIIKPNKLLVIKLLDFISYFTIQIQTRKIIKSCNSNEMNQRFHSKNFPY